MRHGRVSSDASEAMMVRMLQDVLAHLRCPICAGDLDLTGGTLGCAQGHRFDVARQGYANLLPGDAGAGTADTAAMVAARADLLGSGEYRLLTDAVADAAATATLDARTDGCLADAGGGTGHYLAAALEHCPDRVGVACDLSRYAARRAARAHPRIGSVVADVWRGLPLRDRTAAVVLDVFAPRNAAEFHRVLAPEGALVVATPQPDHLGEIVERLGMLTVDESKPTRLRAALDDHFALAGTREVRWTMRLSRPRLRALVQMGPSAWHRGDDDPLDALTAPVEVTGAVSVTTYRARA